MWSEWAYMPTFTSDFLEFVAITLVQKFNSRTVSSMLLLILTMLQLNHSIFSKQYSMAISNIRTISVTPVPVQVTSPNHGLKESNLRESLGLTNDQP